VSGFGAEPGWAPQPGRAGGLASATVTVLAFLLLFFGFFWFFFISTNIVRDLFIPLVGRVFSFSNRFWDGFV
jgi:hypothetical protein